MRRPIRGQVALTAVSIVERIRTWLRENAQGVLHKDDQPLEPLFLGSRDTIVLPADIYAEQHRDRPNCSSLARQEAVERFISQNYLAGGVQGQGASFAAAPTFVRQFFTVS